MKYIEKLLIKNQIKMPIPEPKQGEHEKEFVQRCMTDDKMVTEYPDKDQRYTVCRSQIKSK